MHRSVGTSTSPTFSPGMEVRETCRWLAISGQVGRDKDGDVPAGIEAQAELVWQHIQSVLTAAGMQISDLVDLTIYLINREDGPVFDRVRAKWLQGHKPASTKIFVTGFVDARMVCEVQANAAAPS